MFETITVVREQVEVKNRSNIFGSCKQYSSWYLNGPFAERIVSELDVNNSRTSGAKIIPVNPLDEMLLDKDVAKITIELLDSYVHGDASSEYTVLHGERMEADEYLRQVFRQRNYDDYIKDAVTELFFRVLKHEKLLDAVVEGYYKSRTKRLPKKPTDHSLYFVLLHYALFELDEDSLPKIQNLFIDINKDKALALAAYLRKPDFMTFLFGSAVKIWDIEYVRTEVLGSVQESMFQELYKGIREELSKKMQPKELTRPMEMQVLKRSQKAKALDKFRESIETQSVSEVNCKIRPRPIPKTTYTKPSYPKKLEVDKIKNLVKAKELYEEAQKHAFRVANIPKKEPQAEITEKKTEPIRQSKIPVKKEPSIQPKKTAAVILREGARLMKMEQDEIRRLEDIMKGAFNSESLKAFEREIQIERTRKDVEEIEKKHLQGLLTYEEALIAKQKYLKKTKEAADEFRKEKELWTKQLEAWKADEQIRIRESFEKGKAFEKGAKEAVELVKEEKHRSALETMEKSRLLKEKWLVDREEELKRKIQLINEIKALQAFGIIRRKEAIANANESIGLLCEMTTEELKERLMMLRLEVKEEIEKRREEIKQKKECRKAIVDSYRDLIEQHQELRKQKIDQTDKKPKTPVKSSSVEALKKKLDEKRKQRMKQRVKTAGISYNKINQ